MRGWEILAEQPTVSSRRAMSPGGGAAGSARAPSPLRSGADGALRRGDMYRAPHRPPLSGQSIPSERMATGWRKQRRAKVAGWGLLRSQRCGKRGEEALRLRSYWPLVLGTRLPGCGGAGLSAERRTPPQPALGRRQAQKYARLCPRGCMADQLLGALEGLDPSALLFFSLRRRLP